MQNKYCLNYLTFSAHIADTPTILNLRGDREDSVWASVIERFCGMALPSSLQAQQQGQDTMLWVGPDESFFISNQSAQKVEANLRHELADRHFAITDVSSGYRVVSLKGNKAEDVLTQGCPIDIHQSVFPVGAAAGSLFFQAPVSVWREDNETFAMMVRESFLTYVFLMLERSCRGFNKVA